MVKSRRFTLIEFLVVIAVIVILLAILVPVLMRIRAAANQTQCLSNLGQLGMSFKKYWDDHDNSFPVKAFPVKPFPSFDHYWFYSLLPYYKDHNLRFCPTATNPEARLPLRPWNIRHRPELRMVWPWCRDPNKECTDLTCGGSFGANDFIYSSTQNIWSLYSRSGGAAIKMFQQRWGTADMKNAEMVPLMLDLQYQQVVRLYLVFHLQVLLFQLVAVFLLC